MPNLSPRSNYFLECFTKSLDLVSDVALKNNGREAYRVSRNRDEKSHFSLFLTGKQTEKRGGDRFGQLDFNRDRGSVVAEHRKELRISIGEKVA
ncbi:hypothetical protein CEXT_297321 [Caerostris extrusa]|uniref:Uncharacterized protein n=1 Tax=Caerostris extrusa TaxID=172846 RepID=A0AAV4MGV1_CAEEX|nr:hypothetical protein CEXT_297321 [Caerostris extrusa]